MTQYITPNTGQTLPDIQVGVLTPPNGSPAIPGTQLMGPIISGNILASDGTGNLAGAGAMGGGTANAGYAQMAQSCVITQATNTGSAGQFACPIVIPAQSQIIGIRLMVTTAWTGVATTLGLGTGASATALTTAGAASGATLGPVLLSPGANATQIGNWDNVGAQDVQIVVLSTNTGAGVGTLTVEYLAGINLAS